MNIIAVNDRFAESGKKTRPALQHRLSVYDTPPTHNVTLDEFQEGAYDRITVLKTIHEAESRGLKGDEYKLKIQNVVDKKIPLRYQGDEVKDNLSHYILRLAHCRTEEMRQWFLKQEIQLFRFRFEQQTPGEVDSFLRRANLKFEQITEEEKSNFEVQLRRVFASTRVKGDAAFDLKLYFRVPFEEATMMIKRRQVFVHGGYAFVPRDRVLELVVTRFRMRLSKSLALANKLWPRVATDVRIAPLLKNIGKQYLGRDYLSQVKASGQVTPDQLNVLASRSMPLCMNHLHSELKRAHHLKHWGRLQYVLFLKGIGLTLEHCLDFWRQEFTQRITLEDFQKRYAYNVRHAYGKEGKRQDYTPYSCRKIILGTPPASGDAHGCPFKHWNENHVRAKLSKMKVGSRDIKEIVNLVKSGDYQVACRRHFEATHPKADSSKVGEHPNEWFESSEAFFNQNKTLSTTAQSPTKAKKTTPGKALTPPKAASSSSTFTPPPISSSSKVKAEPPAAPTPATTATAVTQS